MYEVGNELIKGVEILAVNNFYRPTWIVGVILTLIVVLTFYFGLKYDSDLATIIGTVLFIAFAVATLVNPNLTEYHLSKNYATEYQCYIHDDDVDFKEFNDNLELIGQNGNIYTVKLKDKNNE